MPTKFKLNPIGKPFDMVIDPVEGLAHADLTDMPDSGGTNSDHDARYLKLDQTTPQTVTGGKPLFSTGLSINADSQTLLFGTANDASIS